MATVTVLMCAFNSMDYLPEAIESVLSQTFSDFELIVVNDASTDETAAICSRYAAKDSRIRIISNRENIGLTNSLNLALAKIESEYIARLDADDVCMPERLERQVYYLNEHPDVILVGTSAIRISSSGAEIGRYSHAPMDHDEIVSKLVNFEAYCPHSSWMFRRGSEGYRYFYDSFFRYSQDYAFLLALISKKSGNLAFLGDSLIKLRMHSLSITNSEKSFEQVLFSMVANQLYRSSDFDVTDASKQAIFDRMRAKSIDLGLDRSILSYRHLVVAYISLKSLKMGIFLRNIVDALFLSPKTVVFPYYLVALKRRVIESIF